MCSKKETFEISKKFDHGLAKVVWVFIDKEIGSGIKHVAKIFQLLIIFHDIKLQGVEFDCEVAFS